MVLVAKIVILSLHLQLVLHSLPAPTLVLVSPVQTRWLIVLNPSLARLAMFVVLIPVAAQL